MIGVGQGAYRQMCDSAQMEPGPWIAIASTEYPCQLEPGDLESGHCRLVKQSKWSVGATDSVWLKAKAKGMGKEVIGAIVTGQRRQAFPSGYPR